MNQVKSKSILILEAHEPLSDSLMELLSIEGFHIKSSPNGIAGINLAKENLPDLIICASKFSDLDCWEVIQILRKNKSTKKIPFICISDDPLSDLSQIQHRRVTVLTKPFAIEDLLQAIFKYR